MTAMTRKTGTSLHGSLSAEAGVGPAVPLAVGPLPLPVAGPRVTSESWANASGGDWGTAANWSSATVPTSSVAATIGLAGAYTVTITAPEAAQSLSVTDAGATVSDTSTLSIGTTLSMAAGVFQLGNGGEVSGGTISVASGADFQGDGGTLSGVSYHGTLDLNNLDNSSTTIANGITFAGSGGTGSATINLDYQWDQNSFLYVVGNSTLNNVTLNLGSLENSGGNNWLYNEDTNGLGATLTLGPNFTLNEVGYNAAIGSTGDSGDFIVNKGTIIAGSNGGTLSIEATDFTNSGSISVSGGGAIELSGIISSALIDSISIGTGGFVGINGSVTGGTLTSASGEVGWMTGSNGVLNGVSVQGTLTQEDYNSNEGYNASLTIENGTSFSGVSGTGSATINLDYQWDQNSFLYVVGNSTLNNVTLNLGSLENSGGNNWLYNEDTNGLGATLTLGPNFTLNEVGYNAAIGSTGDSGDFIVNKGTIIAGSNGGTLSIEATDFTNSGSISVSGGGAIELSGIISSALIDSISIGTGGFVGINGSVTGGTLTSASGEVGWMTGSNGVLNGVSVQGTLTQEDYNSNEGYNASLTIENGTSFSGVSGTGSATINLDYQWDQNSFLYVVGNSTLNNVTLNLGSLENSGGNNWLYNEDTNGLGATLTLGPNFTLNEVGYNAAIGSTGDSGDFIVNKGTIIAGSNGGTLSIEATDFTNSGSISVSGGGAIELSGIISSALIDSISIGTGGFVGINGSVTGGTLTSASGEVGWMTGSNGVLNGVSVQGTLTQEDYNSNEGYNASLTIENGTSFSGVSGTGSATINLDYQWDQNSFLYVVGNSTLNNVTLNLGSLENSGGNNWLYNEDTNGLGATLTLGPNFTLNEVGYNAAIGSTGDSGDAIVNKGTIIAGSNGGTLSIGASDFTNSGSISVSGGGAIELSGIISSALIDSISIGTGGFVGINGSVTGGTLTSASGEVGWMTGSNGVLNGVSVQGTLTQEDYNSNEGYNASLTIENGTSFSGVSGTGSATINLDYQWDQNSFLYVVGNSTLNNVTLNLGSLENSGGNNWLYNEDTNGLGATLTLGPNFTLNEVGYNAAIGSTDDNGDAIINEGKILAESPGGTLSIAVSMFINDGSITVANGDTVLFESTSLSNLSGTTLTGGTYIADGNSTISLFGNSTIAIDAANIILNGTGSTIQTLDSTLYEIATTGTLTLQNGRDFAPTANGGTFVDDGRLILSAGTLTATGLSTAVAASVFGSGTITAAISDAGLIEANSGYLLLQGAITGAGTLQVDTGSTLEIGGAAPATETTVFNGISARLIIDTPAQYASKLQNFVGSDVIDLAHTTLTSVSTSGTTLLAVSASGTTTLTLAAPLTSLHLALGNDGNGGTDITAYNIAQAASHTPEPVKLGNVHVGATDSAFVTLTNSAPVNGYSEKLDASLGAATGSATATGTVSKLAAGASNASSLAIGLVTTGAGTLSGTATLTLASDGTGVDSFGTTTLASQIVNVSGAVYAYAQGTLANAGTLTLANTHAGHATSGFVTLSNAAATGGYSEALDAAFTGASTGFTTSGTLQGLAAGAQNTNALQIGFSPANVGTYTGTATFALTSDGTGIDGLGTTALAAQTLTVKGAAYGYAVGQIAAGGTVTLANTHVGHTVSAGVGVTNGAAANGFSEALDASITTTTAGLSAAGTIALLAAGASNTTGLSVSANEAAAGAYSGTATVGLVSSGTGIDGLGTTALASQTVTIIGNAYAYAVAQAATQTINLGVVHVGAAASQALTLTNAAAAGVYSEALDASWGAASAGVSVTGSVSLLDAGAHSTTLSIGLSTSSSGSFSGTAALALLSDGSGIDGLGTTALAGQTITVTGIVDTYAAAAFQDGSGPAISGSGTSYAINLGSVVQGSAASTLALGVENTASGLADLLQGTVSAAGTTGFVNSGFGSFSGLGAGQSETLQGVTLTTGTAGVFSETVLLSSAGTNASGYDGALATETLTITGTVVSASTSNTYVLANGPNTILGAAGGDLFQTHSAGINSLDSLTGGSGSNTLQMVGGGIFDFAAPKVFANIHMLLAYEQQAPLNGAADQRQILVMPNSQTETLTVRAGTPANGNTTVETITIYDGADNDVFNLASHADYLYLGSGSDTITLGGSANKVFAGGGTALINATSVAASASVVGTTTGSTVLNLTGGGPVVLNAADTYITVKLNAATHLTLGALGYITVNGGNGGDTIIAGGANQTLIGGAADVLTGSTAGTNSFVGASAALNGDTLGNWTTGDVIDLTDMNYATLQALGFTAGSSKDTLAVTDGTHSAAILFTGSLTAANFTVLRADGSGGTLIGWHAS